MNWNFLSNGLMNLKEHGRGQRRTSVLRPRMSGANRRIGMSGLCCGLLERRNPDGSLIETVPLGPDHNIVTNDGDQYYAERGAVETPAAGILFTSFEFCSAGTPGKTADRDDFTILSGSLKAATVAADNQDAANTGKAIDSVTWKSVYSAGDFTGTVTHVLITIAAPTTGSKLLMGAAITSFPMGASDTLTYWVNHNFLGS